MHRGGGPAGDGEAGKRGAGAVAALLGQRLPPASAAACQHSSALLPVVAVGSP